MQKVRRKTFAMSTSVTASCTRQSNVPASKPTIWQLWSNWNKVYCDSAITAKVWKFRRCRRVTMIWDINWIICTENSKNLRRTLRKPLEKPKNWMQSFSRWSPLKIQKRVFAKTVCTANASKQVFSNEAQKCTLGIRRRRLPEAEGETGEANLRMYKTEVKNFLHFLENESKWQNFHELENWNQSGDREQL